MIKLLCMRHALTGFFLVLMLTTATAQNRMPYIINNAGDTLRGEIRFPQSAFHPDQIIFRQSSGVEVVYTPGMILGFGDARGAVYESRQVARNMAGYGKVTESRSPSLVTENLFLRKIFEGAAELFLFTESSGRNHYFLKKDGKVTSLISHKYLIVSYSAMADTKEYILSLREKLSDCPSLQIPDQLAYTEPELIRILKAYSTCRGVASVNNKAGRGLPALWGVTGSFAKHRWITQPDPFETWKYSYGLFIEADIPSRKGKWTIFSELIYQKQNPYVWENLRISLIPRYYLKGSRIPVFIQTGFAFAGGKGFLDLLVSTGAGVRLGEFMHRPVILDGRAEYGVGSLSKIFNLSAGLSVALNRSAD